MNLPSMKKDWYFRTCVQIEAAKSLADMARDAIHSHSTAPGMHRMAIEVRDGFGPVMQVKFTFEVEKLKH
jgi:hypothetical protein